MFRKSVAVVFAILLVTAPVGGAMGPQLGESSDAAPKGPESIERPEKTEAQLEMSQAGDDPVPEMSVNVPDRVTVGDTFDVTVEAENEGGRAGEFSTITISSPSFSEGNRFDDLSTSLDYKSRFDAGDDVYDKDGDRITAEYALAEAGTKGDSYWESGAEHSFSTEITAGETGTLVFYIRTTFTDDDDPDRKFTAPESPDAYDTQDFGVKRVEVEVEPETENYELDAGTEGDGSLRIYPPGVTTEHFDGSYEEDTVVQLTADPAFGTQFTGWEGDIGFADREDRSIEVTMDQARSLTATFEDETEEYRLQAEAEQGGDLRIYPPGVLTENFARSYEGNTEVELIADPDSGMEFETWEGDIGTADHEDRSIEVTMDQARSLTATFEKPGYELEAETDGDGELDVYPPGVSTEEFARTYEEETEVRLTATPGTDARFAGWSGDVGFADREERSIEVTMDRARSLTAVFESETEEYELTAEADGEGSVRVVPPNIRDQEFSRAYENGTSVRLIADSASETQFSGWEGDVGLADRDARSIEVTMDQARSLTATFGKSAPKELLIEVDESESTVSRDARVGIQETEGGEVRLGSDGQTEFDELESGTYTVYIRSAGQGDVLAVRTVMLEEAESREEVEFSVQGERTVTLKLEDTSVPESRESSGEWVVSIPGLDASVTAPGDEGFVFEDVPPGEYRVVYRPELTESEYMTFSENIRIADDDDTVTIAFNGTEQGKQTLEETYGDRVNEWQEFGMGFVCGEYCFAEDSHNNMDYLTGWIISGIAIFGDARDISNYLIEQKGVELGITVIGLLPAVGDTSRITQIFGKAAKYMEVRKLTKFVAKSRLIDKHFVGILDEIHDGAGTRLLGAGFNRQDLKNLAAEGADIGLVDRHLDKVARIEDLSNARGKLAEVVARATVIPARYGDDVRVVDNVEIVRANGNSAGEIDHVVVKDGKVIGVWETKSAVDDAGKAGTELRKAMAYVERHEASEITLKGTNELDPENFKHSDAIDEGTIGPSDGDGYDETMSLSNSELDRIADDVHDG
jgi:hypothetical protein